MITSTFNKQIDVKKLKKILYDLGFKEKTSRINFYPLVMTCDIENEYCMYATLKNKKRSIEILIFLKPLIFPGRFWLMYYYKNRDRFYAVENSNSLIICEKLKLRGFKLIKSKKIDLISPVTSLIIAIVLVVVIALLAMP